MRDFPGYRFAHPGYMLCVVMQQRQAPFIMS
jgi:hypothetical protein